MNSNKAIKVIITGATGMVGEGVLHECLLDPLVESVIIINRKPAGITHPKLKEIVHGNFFDISPVANQLIGYDACLFCLGVSSIGMKEPDYYKMTYTLTIGFAETLSKLNKAMVFCYISGANTDSTEEGRSMWARVKGKTENDLMKLPFKKIYNFRPGYLHPTPGLKNTLKFYRYISWLYPVFRRLLPKQISTLKELGLAMIHAAQNNYEKNILEVKDIIVLANKN
jgi:hypothetical protein